jgi:hypothetical protein
VDELARDGFDKSWEDYSLARQISGDGRVQESGHGPGQHAIRQRQAQNPVCARSESAEQLDPGSQCANFGNDVQRPQLQGSPIEC